MFLKFSLKNAVAYVVGIIGVIMAIIYGYHRYQFPYGWSHCCDKILFTELENYAVNHDGWFPRGEASPEASLSLLYRQRGDNAALLRGKSVSEVVVVERLSRGDLLTPETCGWHYVEGLRLDDHPRIALFWDKVGLGHNGERLSGGGHVVTFLGGDQKYIPGEEWVSFLDNQRVLLKERRDGTELRADGRYKSGNGLVQVQLRIADNTLYGRVFRQGSQSSLKILAGVRGSEHIIGFPIVTEKDIRNATVSVDEKRETVRFHLTEQDVVFDGTEFQFQAKQVGEGNGDKVRKR